jgi:DNA-directed RNA polymerase subunit RPC12/RpoP
LRIKAGDADAWLKEQDLKWRCANCGSRVWWEQETCFQCGKPISKR